MTGMSEISHQGLFPHRGFCPTANSKSLGGSRIKQKATKILSCFSPTCLDCLECWFCTVHGTKLLKDQCSQGWKGCFLP